MAHDALWQWEDEITWKPRRALFFCGPCFQHRTTTCDVNCIEEITYGARAKYTVVGPEPEKRAAYEAAHRCR